MPYFIIMPYDIIDRDERINFAIELIQHIKSEQNTSFDRN